ncbi:MAG: UvrD-helicase domain-containing protein [bacterium]|nr:UvrD-helicase domain-containing protein [bacterium]
MRNDQEEMNFVVKVIHASAGTGKTHRLTGEFINTIVESKNFIQTMRGLVAITFSEKAACEMKMRIVQGIFDRIVNQLQKEEEKIKCENQLFRLRVSTIHSFCRNLLKRFSFLFQIEPDFRVSEVEQSYIFFQRALSLFLQNAEPDRVLGDLEPMRVKKFLEYMEVMHKTHPQIFLGKPAEQSFTKSLFTCFKEIEKVYQDIKRQNSSMDFNDLESLTYLLITEHPESLNILNDFDEHVDFIFVDEFQDTNLLQWKIIREFSREWISGRGAKAEAGKKYGLFFVGDRKQSIYFFRGAENSVFEDAQNFFTPYVRNEFLTTNYRSFPEVIEFVNTVFDGHPEFPEREKLVASEKFSQRNHGFVEIKLFDKKGITIRDEKQKENRWMAEKILSLVENKFLIFDKEQDTFRPIEFRDIAILIRKRTHLEILEEILREYSIPFVNVGGIGFYQEPEIIFLISLLSAIADPSDDLSLKNVFQSIFQVDLQKISCWRSLLRSNFASSVVDRIVMELDMFSKLGSQGCANVEKFLMLVHEMREMPFFQMVQNFRRISNREEEPKADIFSEQQNAVRVLTVHASKGLEFPTVFLASIEQGKPETRKINLMHRRTDVNDRDYTFIFRKEKDDFYNYYVNKLEEEEKRALYVALTRARQILIITGARQKSVWFDILKNFLKGITVLLK